MRPVRIAATLRPPRIIHRSGNFQRVFDLGVIVPHLAPIERPVRAIAELRARLEPFRTEAQRHHGEMHGRTAHRFAGIVGAHLDRIVAVDDPLIGPVELGLLPLVGGKILERPPIRTGVERHHRESVFGELARQRTAAGAGADDGEVDRLVVCKLPHRHPAALLEDIGCAPADRARGVLRVSRHVRSPAVRAPRLRVSLPRLPTDRAGRNSSARNRAGLPDRRSRSRSMTSDERNRR